MSIITSIYLPFIIVLSDVKIGHRSALCESGLGRSHEHNAGKLQEKELIIANDLGFLWKNIITVLKLLIKLKTCLSEAYNDRNMTKFFEKWATFFYLAVKVNLVVSKRL